jgi:dual specificity phosphatase 12
MEDELLLRHFAACIDFLADHTQQRQGRALVHCVYGQSRSAAVCVAFLMATRRLSLREAYDQVQRARPCIHINTGFLRQLELFERMGADARELGESAAHAEFRAMVAAKDWTASSSPEVVAMPLVESPGRVLRCKKCSFVLCSPNNQVRS